MRVLQSIAVALVLVGSAYAQSFPFPGPMSAGGGGGGSTAPSGFSATTFTLGAPSSAYTYTSGTFNVSAGQAMIVAVMTRTWGAGDFCATITGVTGGSGGAGNTLTNLGEYYPTGDFSVCATVWKIWNPTASASYSLTIQGTASSNPYGYGVEILTFSPGTVAGTTDGSCTAGSISGNNFVCASALTPTGTNELGITVAASSDGAGLYADNSTPPFTPLASSFLNTTNGIGSVEFSTYVGTPPARSITPGWNGVGGGDAGLIMVFLFK